MNQSFKNIFDHNRSNDDPPSDEINYFFNSFFVVYALQLTAIRCSIKLLKTGFEQGFSSIGSNHCATVGTKYFSSHQFLSLICWLLCGMEWDSNQ